MPVQWWTLLSSSISTPWFTTEYANVGRAIRWCYTRRFATTIFSATQRCNIIATLFRMVPTLFQHCSAVLRQKSSLRIVQCNITYVRNATAPAQARPESNVAKLNERDMWAYGIAVLSFFLIGVSVILILKCGIAVSSSPAVSGFSSFWLTIPGKRRSFTVLWNCSLRSPARHYF